MCWDAEVAVASEQKDTPCDPLEDLMKKSSIDNSNAGRTSVNWALSKQ